MRTSQTLTAHSLDWGRLQPEPARPSLHLVIAWSREEPHRIGETATIDGPRVLGRGSAMSNDPAPRATFFRQRPAGPVCQPPLEGPRISRTQLELSPTPEGRLAVKSIGRCILFINSVETTSGVVGPGDTLTLQNSVVFLVVQRQARFPQLPETTTALASTFPFGSADIHGIVGESEAAWALRRSLEFAAQSGSHVLLHGESGVGKELAARALHALSPRSGRPFVVRNAAALPDELVEAELFGNVKGHLAAGMPERAGLLAEADGGTLFLDEVGELPPRLCSRILRLIDRGGEYERIGESVPHRADLRLVAATRRPLRAINHIFAKHFPCCVEIPGLNSRREDIPLLLSFLLTKAAQSSPAIASRFFERRAGRLAEPRIAPQLIDALLRHHYTLHIRELIRLMWIALSTSPDIFLSLTPPLSAELRFTPPEPEEEPGFPAAATGHSAAVQASAAGRTEIETELAKARQALELQTQEIHLLNDELRRQIEQRSRRMMELLLPKGGPLVKAAELAPGYLLGDCYRVVRRIGSGGMGAVYEVERTTDLRRLAAKVLREVPDRAALVRFAQEAHIMARLRHPNLVGISDIDITPEGTLYLVMELVQGTSLWQERSRFGEVDWALAILRQIAEALVALHGQGVVHRDLKPENVLLTSAGMDKNPLVKLADFGISRLLNAPLSGGPEDLDGDAPELAEGSLSLGLRATAPGLSQLGLQRTAIRASGPEPLGSQPTLAASAVAAPQRGSSALPQPGEAPRSGQLTGSGVIMGTPLYMAPELFFGSKNAEPSSDLFSLGVLAFELLTGQMPFPQSPLVLRALGQEVAPLSLREKCPALALEVADVFERCLAAAPDRRPSSVEQIARVLERAET